MKVIRILAFSLSLLIAGFGFGWQIGRGNLRATTIKTPSAEILPIVNKEPPADRRVDFKLFWEVWDRLEKNYVDKTKIDSQKMVWGAIQGLTAAIGDPYTVFLPPQENSASKEDLSGKFEGIGAQLGIKDKKIVVIAPLEGTPAEKAGIKPGDWIIKVDDKETASWSLPETVAKIRGQKGTKVKLQILHEKETQPKNLEIIRETIIIKSVESKIIKDKIGYIKLNRFGEETLKEWDNIVQKFEIQISKSETNSKSKIQNPKLDGIILDLRNNPGGYLNGAVYIASEFLKDGLVVTQDEGEKGKQDYLVTRVGKLLDLPLVVLMNKGSASASEIVAGTLQARNRAKLVGEQSFGKGTVQEAIDLAQGTGLHLTVAKWLLPNNQWINGTGLKPDFAVEWDGQEATQDAQLDKAVELLIK